MINNNSTTRFSDRVEDYVKYRPGYPVEIIAFLQKTYRLTTDKIIADIGSGTGISAKLFLDNHYSVTGIEPNKEMREKSEALLKDYSNFQAIDATAENTMLNNNSIDAIVAGQAFHWFDRAACRGEFERILKPGGLVVLIWNERLTQNDFAKAYDKLIVRYSNDYRAVDHRNIDSKSIKDFCDPYPVSLKIFSNKQVFGFDGLRGRLLSSSYAPKENDENYPAMIHDLTALFNEYQQNNKVEILYDTKVYIARFGDEGFKLGPHRRH